VTQMLILETSTPNTLHGYKNQMPFIPSTGLMYGLVTKSDLHDPFDRSTQPQGTSETSIRLFDGRIDLVLAAYNVGENAVISLDYKTPRTAKLELRRAGSFRSLSVLPTRISCLWSRGCSFKLARSNRLSYPQIVLRQRINLLGRRQSPPDRFTSRSKTNAFRSLPRRVAGDLEDQFD
jgi:hypothetical protein